MSSAPSSGRRRQRSRALSPAETVDLGKGLLLSPRLKLLLTFFRSDLAVKPVDEWSLKRALLDFLRSSPDPLSHSVVDDDELVVRRRPDLHKRKRDEPVASGTLYLNDLSFLNTQDGNEKEKNGDEEILKNKFLEWRRSVLDRLDGIELNLEGVRFKMTAKSPAGDDYDEVKKSWEDFYASQLLDGRRSTYARRPDTVVVRGVPSRWLAEPQVSTKASLLVTHDIFSVLGKIKNIDVADDDDLDTQGEPKEHVMTGIYSKIRVQFETYDDFCNAMKALCGRSMQKQGSRLKVDYQVTWDKYDYSQSMQQKPVRAHGEERGTSGYSLTGKMQNETGRYEPRIASLNSDSAPRKRFRD